MAEYHIPVMLKECLEGLSIKPDGVFVDVTFGGGGHSKAILELLNDKGKLVAFDQDADALPNIPGDSRFIFIDQNFRFLYQHLRYQELLPVDGILADLGVSSYQFDKDERGFSYRFDDAELDMRMNREQALSAKEIVATYSEEQLADLFYLYGELTESRKLARAISESRKGNPITTVGDLKNTLQRFAPKFKDYAFWSRVFQALRIEVNQELEVLKTFLEQSEDCIAENGRLVIMSYHSLEDRMVKNYINTGNVEGKPERDFFGNVVRPFEPVSRKAIIAGEQEQENNTRSRSAKLRIARRIKKEGKNE